MTSFNLATVFKNFRKNFIIRLNKFVEINNLLTYCQYGFRKNRSTSLALMELTEEISTAINNKQITIGVNIDLKKAFDTINHDLLLKIWNYMGLGVFLMTG